MKVKVDLLQVTVKEEYSQGGTGSSKVRGQGSGLQLLLQGSFYKSKWGGPEPQGWDAVSPSGTDKGLHFICAQHTLKLSFVSFLQTVCTGLRCLRLLGWLGCRHSSVQQDVDSVEESESQRMKAGVLEPGGCLLMTSLPGCSLHVCCPRLQWAGSKLCRLLGMQRGCWGGAGSSCICVSAGSRSGGHWVGLVGMPIVKENFC